ncbi:hypothetical protein [Microbacterium sp. NPDC076911]|uniref:hypothetical protein n=1 Tax=Microbacterium sp. NPDC076911 TaxID=3154958 RepID=UPI003422619A
MTISDGETDPALGTNRRYSDSIDRDLAKAHLTRVAAAGQLETLTTAELQLDAVARTVDPVPKPVRAWVRFGGEPTLVYAEACMWTPRAVAIRFKIGEREYRCWVWASAVEALSE